MHPIEHLRHVARAEAYDPAELAVEAAYGLVGLADDRRALLTACRRLIEAHPASGPLWWAAAQVLASDSPRTGAERVYEVFREDPTADELAAAIPGSACVALVPGPLTALALVQRPDLDVRAIVGGREAGRFLRRLRASPVDLVELPSEDLESGLEGAALVLVEALAAGASGVLATSDAARLAVSAHGTIPCWAVVGAGRLLPEELFAAVLECGHGRSSATTDPVDDPVTPEFVAAGTFSRVVCPSGVGGVTLLERCELPVPVELVVRARLG